MTSRTRLGATTSREKETATAPLTHQKRPELAQFRLQVDRQTKGSYATLEDAERAGLAIKRKHPVVQVTVHDAVAGTNTVVEAGPSKD